MMYFPYSLNSRNYACTGVIHQLSALCFVFSAAHAAPSNNGHDYRVIHNVDIQKMRRQRQIPCGPCGTMHDYVAFYFGPHSPMLLQLHTGRVGDYHEGQRPLIYTVSTVEAIARANLDFVFSDGHGIVAFTRCSSFLIAISVTN